jgi:hypothetical protein
MLDVFYRSVFGELKHRPRDDRRVNSNRPSSRVCWAGMTQQHTQIKVMMRDGKGCVQGAYLLQGPPATILVYGPRCSIRDGGRDTPN